MTVLDDVAAEASAEAVEQHLAAAVDRLLWEFPASEHPARILWGAQFDAGLAWVDLPEGRGGLGLPRALQEVVDDRLIAAGYPRPEVQNLVGVCTMAPTVAVHGTDGQRDAYLRSAFTCEKIWCQLFSEPGAGSDLASLATRAQRDGDGWVVNGQKVWTTMAHRADYGILLARTDPELPKHAGLTFFVVDMHAAGVEVRPLRQITGAAEYNEVFLSDVRLDDSLRVGDVDGGWSVALAALHNEREIGTMVIRRSKDDGPMATALELWAAAPEHARTPLRRDTLARLWIDAKVLQLTSQRADALRRAGKDVSGVSISHVQRGPLAQDIADFCMDLRGAQAMLVDHYDLTRPDHFTHVSGEARKAHPSKTYLAARALTIAGGSLQISKNVLAERVLGLPAEARADKGLPWNQTRRSHGARG